MYENLLAAMDHSKITERVLAAARDLTLLSHDEVWVLHVRELEALAGMSADHRPVRLRACGNRIIPARGG